MVLLADLLADRALGLTPIVRAARAPELRWVATSELDDPSAFLEGGEVLLTTGLDKADWSDQWVPYVERLVAVDVVGIGLALGLTFLEAPADLVSACEQCGLDLFVVPRETPFVAVSRAVADLIRQEEDAEARRSLEHQRGLTAAAALDDEAALLERIATIGSAAALVDTAGQIVLGSLGPDHGEQSDLTELSELSELVIEAVRRMRPLGLRAASSVTTGGSTQALIHPVGVRGRPHRYLVIVVPTRVAPAQRTTVATAVALVSLAEERRHAGLDAERRLRRRAIELLIAGDERTASVVLGVGTSPRPRLAKPSVMLFASGTSEALDDGMEELERRSLLAGRLDAEDALVVCVARREATEAAHALAAVGLRVGVGDGGADDAPASLRTARYAHDMTTVVAPVMSWAGSVRRGVLNLVEPGHAKAFADGWLAPLASDPDLIETLRSFLAHHGSILKVADDLGIHRNTVANRMERIQAAMGVSMDDPQARVDSWVALQIHKKA